MGIHEIVLTGGPSAGKSSSLAFLKSQLEAEGFFVLCCPEAATIILQAGTREIAADPDHPSFAVVQENIFRLQHDLRTYMRRLARASKQPCVIFYDRAELDSLVYCGQHLFSTFLEHTGGNIGEIKAQYDGVVHMSTVAHQMEHLYETSNHPARWDSPQQAREKDQALLEAWAGSEHLWVVPAYPEIQDKQSHLLECVHRIIGIPQPVEYERKWLLGDPPPTEHLEGKAMAEICQTYLLAGDGSERRVRQRIHQGWSSFSFTEKTSKPGGGRYESESQIDAKRYKELLAEASPNKQPIEKQRWCWTENDQYWELDYLPLLDLWFLEAETLRAEDRPTPPAWLGQAKDVTDDPQWRMGQLADKIESP